MNNTTNDLSNNEAPRASGLVLLLAFLAVYIIWGTTYLAIRFGLLGMKPFVLITLRYLLAAAILFAWCRIAKLPIGSVVLGEQYINSGNTAVIIATSPLLFLLIDRNNWKSYTPVKLAGLLLGFAGVFIFSRFTTGGSLQQGSLPQDAYAAGHRWDSLKGTGLVLLSTVFWVSGTLYARKQKNNTASPVANAAIQHVAAALAGVLVVLLNGDWKTFHPALVPAAAWGGLAYLVIMGSLVAFMAFMFLVKVQPPAIVSTYTYVNPIVAVLAGWIIAGETISLPQVMALLMVLVGVLLVQSPRLPKFLVRQPRCEAGS
jgi:drug/metabolite transporter (DMT)-like permease